MSLPATRLQPVPRATARVARQAFPKGNVYLSMRDELGSLYRDADFQDLFPRDGQPALAPWRLALILVMQFAEGLSDRQAANAVRARIDWKDALALELDDAGFDFSVLSEFRVRLLAGGAEARLLDLMLTRFRERGWLKARGRQRTDSTRVLAAVRAVNRLESLVETLRAAFNAVASAAPEWLRALAPAEWFERYTHRAEDFRLPQGKQVREDHAARSVPTASPCWRPAKARTPRQSCASCPRSGCCAPCGPTNTSRPNRGSRCAGARRPTCRRPACALTRPTTRKRTSATSTRKAGWVTRSTSQRRVEKGKPTSSPTSRPPPRRCRTSP